MVYFDNCVVLVNGSGVLADSVSVQSQNGIIPIFSIGKKGMMSQEPDGPISSNIDISYYLDLGREPLFPVVDQIKNITGSYSGITISIANITGRQCYLTDYRLSSTPNSLIKVDATFATFVDITGDLNSRPTGFAPISDFSGRLAMGWTTHVVSGGSYVDDPIYDFNYNVSFNWEPTYLLGQRNPSQVDFMGATEKMEFVKETYKMVQFSGEEAARNSVNGLINAAGDDKVINFYGYTYINNNNLITPTLTLSLSGHEIQESNLTCDLDDFFRNSVQTSKFFN